MLPNHSPLVIAGVATLEALHPGRIDQIRASSSDRPSHRSSPAA